MHEISWRARRADFILGRMNPEALQKAALNVAQAISAQQVLSNIAGDLAREPSVALARIWLLRPGDICSECALQRECHDRSQCLHLMASAGSSLIESGERYVRTDGRYRRFPIGVRKVGQVAATGEELLLQRDHDSSWAVDPDWIEREGIVCFAGQPLIFRGKILGVLAVFARSDISLEELGWLRTFADHAATALANRSAFEEVQDLRQQLQLERDYLREEIKTVQSFGNIVGDSSAIKQVMHQVDLVARTEATVLIEGESGTGKELIAGAVHEASARSEQPLVRVNCASIPHELFESEFFGHLKGSFTGATRDRAGRFMIADGGTLFLDEVGEIPLELQGKLLRVLQEGQFSRIGEDTERSVNVRIIAATNRDLQAEVRAGRFREDLYYRLTVFPIRVPPLRERPSDIPLLARHFAAAGFKAGTQRKTKVCESDLALLQAYGWPGNVRELQNVIQRALIGTQRGRLNIQLPIPDGSATPSGSEDDNKLRTMDEMRLSERKNLIAVLDHFRWKIAGSAGAASFLGINPGTLTSRLKALGIERPRSSGS